jgi:hypothetical protein
MSLATEEEIDLVYYADFARPLSTESKTMYDMIVLAKTLFTFCTKLSIKITRSTYDTVYTNYPHTN